MRKFGWVAACASAAVLLAACGGGQGGAESARPQATIQAADSAAESATLGDVAAEASRAGGTGPAAKSGKSIYIVEMADAPVLAYTGGVKGYNATRPAAGRKIDPNAPDVTKYAAYLDSRHDAKVAAVGGRKVYSYRYTYAGFAAELTDAQAAALAADKDVVSVSKDEKRKLDTVTTPAFLGLTAPGGFWSALSGNADGNPIIDNGPNSGGAGEGVVVGIVDSGIWPEHPSFSDRDATGKLVFQQLPGWNGKCVPGEAFNASDCNQKLIAARAYAEGFGGFTGVKQQFAYEFASPRAADGHGVHTAGTAAGNYRVDAVVGGSSLGRISGMAPRARVAVYKVCWGDGVEGGCFSSDSVAAIDQAVADGVDVINFSISGTSTNFRDSVEIAFLRAADAGVFVAASAGNSGPTASTVAHPSPWITTVAASSHDRFYLATLKLGNGASYDGAGLGAALPTAPMILAKDAGVAGADAAALRQCFTAGDNGGTAVLDPAKVSGKIVVCDRGTNARVSKSQAVKDAGGVGMVLLNLTNNSLNADIHAVPTVHLNGDVQAAVKAYVAGTATPTASLTAGIASQGLVTAPLMAAFSSRGPLRAGNGDLLKPDITAPGVDVLAAVSPVLEGGKLYDFLSGTSMSSPHIAGLAALMKQKFPTWSPMAIKSALMTTAYQTTKTGASGTIGTPFDMGAGHVDINKAMNPGVVFDSGFRDWLGFLCGTQLPAGNCTSAGVPVLDPSDLNVPSIAIGDLAGVQTVKRRLTNVSGAKATFTAAVSGLGGITVAVSPASFTLNPGQTQEVSVTFTTAGAALNAYRTGAITWTSSGGHTARIPAVVRPVALAAPTQVQGTGAAMSWGVRFGYTGPFSAAARGLVLPAITAGTVQQDPDQTFDPADPTGTVAIPVTIPAGSTYARIALFDSDVAAGADIDVYVYQGSSRVGASANGGSQEEVNFTFATPLASPLSLTVYLHGWGLPAGSSPYKLHVWTLGTADAGNMTLTVPAAATLAGTGTLTATPAAGLGAGRWLGSVAYAGAPGLPAPTIVRVDK